MLGEVGVDRVIVGMATLPFVIFAFLRIFVRENRLVDETFIERARGELATTRARCDQLTVEVDNLHKVIRAERRRAERLEEELIVLRMQFDLLQQSSKPRVRRPRREPRPDDEEGQSDAAAD